MKHNVVARAIISSLLAMPLWAAAMESGAPLPLLPAPPPLTPEAAPPPPTRDEMKSQRDVAVNAFIKQFPEVFQGPEQTGVYAVRLLMLPDGTLIRSSKLLLQNEQLTQNSQVNWPILDVGANSYGGTSGQWIRGTPLAAGKTLRVDVAFTATFLPQNFDPARSALRVQDAVLARHADLLVPESSTSITWLRVLMNENGTIAREHVETMKLEDAMAGKKIGPSAFDRMADVFKVLGLEDDQLGVMGHTPVDVLANGMLGSAPSIISHPSQISGNVPAGARGMTIRKTQESRSLVVSYVWPRRPGEPAGGTTGAGMTRSTYTPPIDPAIALMIAERYFPGSFLPMGQTPDKDAWVLLSRRGEVLRTGMAEPRMRTTFIKPSGEKEVSNSNADRNAVLAGMPGIKVGGSYGTGVRNSAGLVLNMTFFWLEPDSPLPPLGN